MLKNLCLIGAAVGALSSAAVLAQTSEVTLTRLDCGNGFNDSRRFSDTFAYSDPKMPFTFSCYLIRHHDLCPLSQGVQSQEDSGGVIVYQQRFFRAEKLAKEPVRVGIPLAPRP